MQSFVRSMGVLLVAAGAGLAACGEGGGGPTETDPTQIRVTVRADGAAEAGITVRLFAPGGTTALEQGTTNASGQITFTDLNPDLYDDAYEVEVVVPEGLEVEDGAAARRGVTVTAGQTTSIAFNLITPIPDNVRVVTLQASSFSPSAVTIDVGMKIRWVNGAAVTHTITPDGHSQWSSQTVTADGQTFEHTFNNTGVFPYLCQFHAGMTGTITVN